jgi:hypothetical protein
VAYSVAASFFLFLYFLIPGSSILPGENIGTFLPLRALQFLGVPTSAVNWGATTALAHEVWLPILNLYVPLAMCVVALYLLTSKWRASPSKDGNLLDPLELRATKACVPLVVLLVIAVGTYWLEPTHVKSTLIGVVQNGLTHYAFVRNIYSWATWHKDLFWTVLTPYKDTIGGDWWGSIIVVGPLMILAWAYFSLRRRPRSASDLPG